MLKDAGTRRAQYGPLVLLFALYTATFGAVASALHSSWGFPLDDSYIYQNLARALATPAAPDAYLAGSRFAGATSPLWLLVQTLHAKWVPAADPVTINAFVGWLLLVSTGLALWTIASADRLSPLQRWLLAGTPALCGNLLWLGLIGMEHLLFLLLSLLTVVFWFSRAPASDVCAGAAAGLLALTRPEAGLLGLLCLTVARHSRSRGLLARFAATWLALVAALIAFHVYAFHSVLPSTLQGRTWLYFRNFGPHSAKALLGFPGQLLRRLPQLVTSHFVVTAVRLRSANLLFTLTAVVLAACVLAGAAKLFRTGGPRVRLLLLWTAIHTGTYLLLLPATGHGGRYQPELLLLALPGLFTGVWMVLQRSPLNPRWRYVVLTCVVVVTGVSSVWGWRTVSVVSIHHIQRTHGAMAAWIAGNLPGPTRIASFDSGEIAYRLNRPILDLGGLTDPSLVPYLKQNNVEPYLAAHSVRYVVLPRLDPADDFTRDDFRFLDTSHARSLAEFCSPEVPWRMSLSYTGNAWRCQKLYDLGTASR